MSKLINVYCEGKKGSPDFDLLNKVVHGLTIQIIPIGGKTGAKSFIRAKEEGLSKSDFKLFFRDRDFDMPVPDTEKLQNDGSYVYFSYRTTIENYLLEYDTMQEYAQGKPWSANLEANYMEAAKKIKFFQAARHTLGALRVATDFGTNIVPKSGDLPQELSESFCRNAGFERISKSVRQTESWNKKKYDDTYDEFVAKFDDEDFFQSKKFLIYFQGKDFMKSLCRELPQGFSPKHYYQYATAKFNYQKFSDFVELRRILEDNMK